MQFFYWKYLQFILLKIPMVVLYIFYSTVKKTKTKKNLETGLRNRTKMNEKYWALIAEKQILKKIMNYELREESRDLEIFDKFCYALLLRPKTKGNQEPRLPFDTFRLHRNTQRP